MIKNEYDVVIAGGGPAGLNAAIHCADEDIDVAVFEKDREIGVPFRCGEAVSKQALEKYAFIDEDFIHTTIDKFQFFPPSGKSVLMDPEKDLRGYILDRRRFEQALAHSAAENGAKIFTRSNVLPNIKRKDNGLELEVAISGEKKKIHTKLLIAADGVESKLAGEFGIDTSIELEDFDGCYQMTLTNLDLEEDTLGLYLSNEYAPGGYIWVFPKDENTANVGLGVNGRFDNEQSAKEKLVSWIDSKFDNPSILNSAAGGVSASKGLKKQVDDNFIVVGDAARMTNPLTGGGISYGLASGKWAGQIVKQSFEDNDLSRNALKAFEKKWKKTVGKDQKRFYRLKEGIMKFDDEDYEKIADKMEGEDPEDVTLKKLFTTALKRKPSLLIDVTKVFAGI